MNDIVQGIRGPILTPLASGGVAWWPDGVVVGDGAGRIRVAGPWGEVAAATGLTAEAVPRAAGIVVPPLLDAHIHIPQHPIRGRFAEGIDEAPPEGWLLASLDRNVYPAEALCACPAHARAVVEAFAADTLAHGVIGGAAYMTVHPQAARIALERLPDTWSVGLVLMNRRCPANLRTDEATLVADIAALAADFGRRLIVTDRFAVCVDSPLRQAGVAAARRHGLRMQTHLDEQRAEKRLVEEVLYPEAASYTEVYRRDGLLDCEPLLAHCIHLGADEVAMIAASGGAVVHCPVSNALLGSGVMPLDVLRAAGIPLALGTDVGASPTTSLLCEMATFLKVHAGSSAAATPEAAFELGTIAPARILGLADRLGTLTVGREFSFLEVACPGSLPATAGEAILGMLRMQAAELGAWRDPADPRGNAVERLRREGLDEGPERALLEADVRETAARLDGAVRRVTLRGRVVVGSVTA